MKIAVMGAGAVGSYFGALLARDGHDVTIIGRDEHVEAVRAEGLRVEGASVRARVALTATTSPAGVKGAELVLFSVKSFDTDAAAAAIAPFVGPQATLLSLQNGIENAERIRAVVEARVLPCVVYVAVCLEAPGVLRHTARGDLVFGEPDQHASLRPLSALLARAGIPNRLADDLPAAMWGKLVVNCATNASTALAGATYATLHGLPEGRALTTTVVEETTAVARATGVEPAGADPARVLGLVESFGGATSSMAQDLARGRRTETDAMNGFVARKGRELGVPAPVNAALHQLVTLLEAQRARART